MKLWVLTINIKNGIIEPTHAYQNWTTNQILMFVGYLKVRESLYIGMRFRRGEGIHESRLKLQYNFIAERYDQL